MHVAWFASRDIWVTAIAIVVLVFGALIEVFFLRRPRDTQDHMLRNSGNVDRER